MVIESNSKSNEQFTNDSNYILEHLDDKKPLRRFFQKNKVKKIINKLPLISILIGSLIIRIIAAWNSAGFVHPDEVFQSIEMVHYWIFGEYGNGVTIPWEYNEDYLYGGARSWFFVLILVAIYRFVMLFGTTDPLVLIFCARLFLAIFSMVTVIIAYFFGKEIFNEQVGLIGAFLCGIWWFFPFWASRTMTDSISSDLLFLCIFLVYKSFKLETKNNKKKLLFSLFAGILLGIAFMLRFPSALMGIPLAFCYFIKWFMDIGKTFEQKTGEKLSFNLKPKTFFNYLKEKKIIRTVNYGKVLQLLSYLGLFCLGAFFIVIMQGILDLITWGDFLQSPINFFIYNIVEGKSAQHGQAKWYFYFGSFYVDFGLYYLPFFIVFFVLGLCFKEKLKTKGFIGFLIVFWLVTFSAIAHKEFRFIFIVLPFVLIFVANGIIKFVDLLRKKISKQIVLGLILTIFFTSSTLIATYHYKWRWDVNSGICNAMYFVGKQENSDRLFVFESVWYTGGYAYLDKNITTYFIRIYPWDNPSVSYNSTYYRFLYTLNGTYCVVREDELYYLESILENLGMIVVAEFNEFFRTVYVYN